MPFLEIHCVAYGGFRLKYPYQFYWFTYRKCLVTTKMYNIVVAGFILIRIKLHHA